MEEEKINEESLLFIRYLKDTNQYIDFRCKVIELYANKSIPNKIFRLFTKNSLDIIIMWLCRYISQSILSMKSDFTTYKQERIYEK